MRIPGNLLFQDNAGNPVGGTNLPQQNILINGGFEVWQRGLTFTNVSSEQYFADRWQVYKSSSDGALNISKDDSITDGKGQSSAK
jgi:hypothetical protein